MPKLKATKQEVIDMYVKYKDITNNFTEIHEELLMEDARFVFLLRLLINKSQKEFAKITNINYRNLPKYEHGKIKQMQLKTASRCIRNVVINHKSLKEVLSYFEKNKIESEGWFKGNKDTDFAMRARRLGAINSLSKQYTLQEKKISNLLKKHNMNNLINHCINLERGIIVDIFLPHQKLIIECKNLKTKSRRSFRREIQKLAFQGYKIKYYHNLKILALVESELKLLSKDIQELKGPFNEVFVDKHALINFLRKDSS